MNGKVPGDWPVQIRDTGLTIRTFLLTTLILCAVQLSLAQEHLTLKDSRTEVRDGLYFNLSDLRSGAGNFTLGPENYGVVSNGFPPGLMLSGLWPLNPITPEPDITYTDSLPPSRVRRLLPANISFMEKAMWGETGFMRTTGIVGPLTPEERQSELGVRRPMLSLHQIGGFTSLGLMITTVYFGQRSVDNPLSRGLRNDHQTFVAATIATYSATAVLALFSPPPLIRRDEISTTTIHKTLAWAHVIGMIVTPILGSAIGRNRDPQRERVHQISGYITTAIYAASMITVTF